MRFARAVDMEPGFRFRPQWGGRVLTFTGVDPVASRFAGRHRVRVRTRQGVSWVCDWAELFVVVAVF